MIARDHIFFNAFNQIPQIGSVRMQRLLNFFPNLETAWQASRSDLRQAGLEDSIVMKILELKSAIDPETEYAKLETLGIRTLTFLDKAYPELLLEIPSPPALLYIKGELTRRDERAIAVVGTRRYTSYGKQVVT